MHAADVVKPSLRHDDSGFTLVELLVAMSAAVVVLFALTAILVAVMRGTQRTFTQLNASQRSRTAIADLENELHSACIGGGQVPIQAGSDGSTLQFLTYYGAAASPTPVWHKVAYDSSKGTLTDTSYAVTGATANWTKGSQTSSVQLLTNVTQRSSSSAPIPVFQYYAYQPANGSSASGYWFVPDGTTPDPVTSQLTNLPLSAPTGTGLSAGDAADTTEVVINLSVGSDSETLNNPSLTAVNDQIDDAISLRLTIPPDQVPSSTSVAAGSIPPGYGPCE